MNVLTTHTYAQSETDESTATKLLELIKQYLESLHYDDTEDINLDILTRETIFHDSKDIIRIINILQHRQEKYQRSERFLREVGTHFTKVYKQHKECITTLKTTLQTMIDQVDNLYNSTAPGVTHLEPPADQLSLSLQSMNERTPLERFILPQSGGLPHLQISCFGAFEIRRNGYLIPISPNRSAQNILRYLLTRTGYIASAEQMIEVIWPEDDPKSARNKLYIAVSALRRSLQEGITSTAEDSYLVCRNRTYSLNPNLIHTDADIFLKYYHIGQSSEDQAHFYRQACDLYRGPYLQDEIYADWSFLAREEFNHKYIFMCKFLSSHYISQKDYSEAIVWTKRILSIDKYDECGHRLLMQIYALQGDRSKAIQQYNYCEHLLSHELGIEPMPDTTQFYESLLCTNVSIARRGSQ